MLRRVHLSQLVVVAAVCCVLLLTPPAQPLLPFVSAQQESPNHQQQQPQPVQLLAPFDYLNGQLVDLDSGVNLYRFRGLKPHTGYELRVSFPASIPVTVKLAVVGPPLTSEAAAGTGAGELLQGRRAAGRRLLDTEKLIFTTDAQAAVEGVAEPHLELRAYRRSVHRDGPTAGAPKLVYNIVLAELVVGIPRDIIPTVATIVLVVLVTLVASLIWSNRFFPQLLDYLIADTNSSSHSTAGTATGSSAAIRTAASRSKRSQ